MAALQFFLLGAPRLEQQHQNINLSRRKAIAALAYLAVTRQPHSRDELATLLWPDQDQSGARANLRRDLSTLKRTLGDKTLFIDRALQIVEELHFAPLAMWILLGRRSSSPITQRPGDEPGVLIPRTEVSDNHSAGFAQFDQYIVPPY